MSTHVHAYTPARPHAYTPTSLHAYTPTRLPPTRLLKSQNIAYFHVNMPLKSSNLPGAGPIFPDRTFENGRGEREREREREIDSLFS